MLQIRNASAQNPAVLMGLSPVKRFTIADGDLGTSQTIDKIRKLVHDGMTDQALNRFAIAIVRAAGVQQFDFLGEIRAIYQWVQGNIRFIRDVFGVETLRTPREILTTRAGDCDDINATLLPAMLMTIGAHVRLVTISSDPRDPNTFSHVYCEAELPNGQWLPLDAARRDPAFGRGPNQFFRMRRWSLTDNGYEDLPAGNQMRRRGSMGLGGYFPAPRGHRSMGDFSDIADSISELIGAGTTGAANIIRSIGLPQPVPQGYARNPVNGQLVPITPQGTLYASSYPGGVMTSASGTIPDWMLYAGFGLAALMVLKK